MNKFSPKLVIRLDNSKKRPRLLIIALLLSFLSLLIAGPDYATHATLASGFDIMVNTDTATVRAGNSVDYALVLTSHNTSATIQLILTSYPDETNYAINPAEVVLPINGSTVSILTISTNLSVIAGNYTLTVLARSAEMITYSNIHLEIISQPQPVITTNSSEIIKTILTTALALASMLIAVVGILISIYAKLRPTTDKIMLSFRKLIWRIFFVLCLGGTTSIVSLVYLLKIETFSLNTLEGEICFYIIILLFVVLITTLVASVYKTIKRIFATVI